jgi:triacylglycerol lipase
MAHPARGIRNPFRRDRSSVLCPDGYAGPKGVRPLIGECRTLLEGGSLLGHPVWRCTDVPAGNGLPVVLIPGFMVGDSTLLLMSRWLRARGYDTYRSRVRMNVACTQATVERIERRIDAMADEHGTRVAVVGHSLGGMLGKALAVRRPDLVAGVVSLGSPHLAPIATHRLLRADLALLETLSRAGLKGVLSAGCTRGECATEAWEQLNGPFPGGVPFTSVYSQTDGIIDWQACLDPAAEHVEVKSSHCGMAVHPHVYRVVGERLGALAATRSVPTAA